MKRICDTEHLRNFPACAEECGKDTCDGKPVGEKFWMVLVDGTLATSYKHYSLIEAKNEAARLLGVTGRDIGVTILEAVMYGYFSHPPVEWKTDLETVQQDEVPF